jgi:hypothetical protein
MYIQKGVHEQTSQRGMWRQKCNNFSMLPELMPWGWREPKHGVLGNRAEIYIDARSAVVFAVAFFWCAWRCIVRQKYKHEGTHGGKVPSDFFQPMWALLGPLLLARLLHPSCTPKPIYTRRNLHAPCTSLAPSAPRGNQSPWYHYDGFDCGIIWWLEAFSSFVGPNCNGCILCFYGSLVSSFCKIILI